MTRDARQTRLSGAAIGKGGYRHFMEKELHEHPVVIGNVLNRMIDPATRRVALPDPGIDLASVSRVTLSACGSAFYAGLVGRVWLESLARLPTDGDVASEFRYRAPPLAAGGLGLLVSQSGETADTLRRCAICRTRGSTFSPSSTSPESSMARGKRCRAGDACRSRDRGSPAPRPLPHN